MRNPLIKRIPRELKTDWHKYLVIIVFMMLMIGVVSGMYVGHDSMLAAVYEGKEELNLEDGSFELDQKASEELLNDISTGEIPDNYMPEDETYEVTPTKIYEHFYRNESEDNNNDGVEDATVRIYKSDSEIDRASFKEGRAPENSREIAIDRMHAENVGVGIGDTIAVGDKTFEIVGLLSYVNYLTLHESNTDLMFDAFGFDVAMVTPEAFDELSSRIHYSYAYKYLTAPASKIEQADFADNFLKVLMIRTLVNGRKIEDFLPEYLRQGSNFAVSDIDGDSVGASILCYILIAVIAFIFAITISNTIDKEASVIGTLRASGYSKKELILHYMSMPVVVTILGSLLGNILGYTAFRDIAVYLYYNSYSLPTCHTVWSNAALIKTTVIPLILMFAINLTVIVKKLQLSPLQFLRHDLVRTRRTKARRLPRWSFIRRFRLRILFQNMPNYLVLIFGVIFIELMMCFAFGLPDSLKHYAREAPNMMFAEYQYMLMNNHDDEGNVIKTSEKSAEKFSMTELLYPKEKSSFREGMGSGGDEKVTVYGIIDGSSYIDLAEKTGEGKVYISSAFSKKFGLSENDTIELNAEYEDKSYEFSIMGTVEYDGGIAVFLDDDSFKKVFEKEDDDFSGFFAHKEITDIDEMYIATVITSEDIIKVTKQLMHSMGGFMEVFKYILIVLSASLIYLLAKIIIERNEHSISMAKILGFVNGEIGSLYIVPTAAIVVLFAIISFGVGYYLMIWIFHAFMLQMNGYFAFYMTPSSMILTVVYLLVGYAMVSLVDLARIRRIPLDVALKNIE